MTAPSLRCKVSVLLLLLVSGCGGAGGTRVDVHPITGKITLAGAPVVNATVIFSPRGEQPVATGRTNERGEYQLTTYEGGDGAATGEYAVLVTKSIAPTRPVEVTPEHEDYGKLPSHAAAGGGGTAAVVETGLPDKYSRPDQTDLKATVSAGGQTVFDFDLTP